MTKKSRKRGKPNPNSMIFGLILLVIGILFVVFPTDSLNIICYVSGCFLIIYGIVMLFLYFMHGFQTEGNGFVVGAAAVCMGILLIAQRSLIQGIISLLFGFVLFLGGLTRLQTAIGQFRRRQTGAGVANVVLSVLFLSLGILVFVNPFSDHVFGVFIGVSLIVEGVCEITSAAVEGKPKKAELDPEKEIQETDRGD